MKLNIPALFRRPEKLFLIIASFFGLVSALTLPVLTAPDEGAHFWMSYSMFSSHSKIPDDLLVSAEDSVKSVAHGTYVNNLIENTANLENDGVTINYSKESKTDSSENLTNFADDKWRSTSFDITHLPQAIGILLGKLIHPSTGVMVILGRLANLAVFVTALYFVIKHLKYGKLAFAFIALIPMMIQQAGSLSYDVMNAVAIFAWFGLMINLSQQTTRLSSKQLILIIILGIFLLANKRSNVLLLALLPFLNQSIYLNGHLLRHLKQWKKWLLGRKKIVNIVSWVAGGIIAISLLYLFDQHLAARGVGFIRFCGVVFNTFFRPEVNSQLDSIITTGVIGNFAWLWYRLPSWIVFLQFSVLGLILLGDKVPKISKRFAIASGLTFFASIAGITLGMYFAWTLEPSIAGPSATFIQGMQGRYFTPLLILLIPVFAYLQKHISVKIAPELLHKIAWSTAIFSLTIYVILTWIFFYTPADGVKDILLK